MALGREYPHSFDEALKVARKILSSRHDLVAKDLVDTEAEQLVIAAYEQSSAKPFSRMDLYSRIADRFPEKAGELLLTWATRRAEGRLLQHLTGKQAFLDHVYEVSPAVLIPRPETELLVSIAAAELRQRGLPPALGLEVGAGSGAISIELLGSIPGLRMIASELEAAAEAVARKNAVKILGQGANRLEIVRSESPSEVLEPFARSLRGRKAQFLISNPPYLASGDGIEEEVRAYEPHSALFAPESDLFYFYRQMVTGARNVLEKGAPIFVEVPHERASAIAALFQEHGYSAALFRDLNDRERILVGKING